MASGLIRLLSACRWSGLPWRIHAACIHFNCAPHAKREDKWKSNVYGYMDASSVRKRHATYEKRQKRAEAKRKLHVEWRCLEVDGGEMQAMLEQKQRHMNFRQEHASSGVRRAWWSQRYENDWKRYSQKHKVKHAQHSQAEGWSGWRDGDDPSSGTRAGSGGSKQNSRNCGDNYWSSSSWEYYAGRGASSARGSAWGDCREGTTVGSLADRQVLGLSPTGPLTLEAVKDAFRQCALKWHPDRHLGASKEVAESKFKRVGAAYKALLQDLMS